MYFYRKSYLFLISLIAILCISSIKPLQAQEIKITHGPYLQALTDSTVSIVWTTDKPSISWVELAPDDKSHFYKEERPQYFASKDGLKTIGTLHEVKLTKLSPNTTYRYRIFSKEVLKHVGNRVLYGNIASTSVYQVNPLTFKTNGPRATVNFSVINDLHGKNDLMKRLFNHVDLKATDFVVFNGDMINHITDEKHLFDSYMDTAIHLFAKEIPMYYARGNHETRGPFAQQFSKYFVTNTGKLYYTMKVGDAYLIFLDSGEDKPDSDIEYSGISDMDKYRSEQAVWLEEVLQSPEAKASKYKIIICHMPPIEGWHGGEDLLRKFVPVLNKHKIDVMLSGHLHKHVMMKENATVRFPIIVNKNDHLINVNLNSKSAEFKIMDEQGKLVDKLVIQKD